MKPEIKITPGRLPRFWDRNVLFFGTRFLFDSAGVGCGVAILPDSGSLNEIAVEEKGLLHVQLATRGSSGHASRPWLADNPLARIIAALGRIEEYFIGLKSADDHWHPTCTITVVQTENRVSNRVPASGEAVCDIRFPPPYTSVKMISELKQLLDEKTELQVLVAAEPTRVSPDPLYLTATEEITGKPVKLIREHGGSDARFISRYGIPVIMSRPLVGNLHAGDEWIDIASMEILYRIYDCYLEKKLGPLASR